jgi:hypothetical protein
MPVTVFRFDMKANMLKGLMSAPGGQLVRLNPEMKKVDLSGIMAWSEKQAGDLVLIGHWFEITAALGAANGLSLESRLSARSEAVDSQMDDMYGPLPGDDPGWLARTKEMPFYVSGKMGAAWVETTELGKVVADPLGDTVRTVVGRGVGVMGAAAPIPGGAGGVVTTTLSAAKDLAGMIGPAIVGKAKESREEQRKRDFDGSQITIIVGVAPSSRKYSLCTESTTLSNMALLKSAVDVTAMMWRGVRRR